MSLERIWAGWREEYVASAVEEDKKECILCRVRDSDDKDAHIIWRGELCFVVLNAYPYTSGHVMIIPNNHIADYEALSDDELAELSKATSSAIIAIKNAYAPDGLNIGSNIGRAAGAGIESHYHSHVLPRWVGDTNFMTALTETRVLPETLSDTAQKLRGAWPI